MGLRVAQMVPNRPGPGAGALPRRYNSPMDPEPIAPTAGSRAPWAGTAARFCRQSAPAWLADLAAADRDRRGRAATATQLKAWADCRRVVARALRAVFRDRPDARDWGLAFEYELPWEGGRRPDLVLLASGQVLVVEFKMATAAEASAVDQVAAYARDLELYHAASRDRPVRPILVPTRSLGPMVDRDGVLVLPPGHLAAFLAGLPAGEAGPVDLGGWLDAEYAPLPGVVDAARRIFRREPLPNLRQAEAAGIPAVLKRLEALAAEAAGRGGRHIALITGVPGAGKTLVGLELVHRHGVGDGEDGSGGRRDAVFLSGNGPLVEVLQHALRSKVFVRPVRNFYIEHEGRAPRAPAEHLFVFDEAQRAWDAARMAEKYAIDAAAPAAVAAIAGRAEGWSLVVGLIGAGQEIHAGEEGGPALWLDAATAGGHAWAVHCPPHLAGIFDGLPPDRLDLVDAFDLTRSLRSHRADRVQAWVDRLLAGELDEARALAEGLAPLGFAARLTRDLDAARAYCRARYADAPGKTYGLLASSRARNLPRHGVPNDYPSTQRVRLGPWFVDPPDSPASCRALDAVATEFGCQGLELDLPIVAWGDDLTWDGAGWSSRVTRQKGVRDPARLRLNSYRVLLSRGRDGLVAFVPPDPALDPAHDALARAGLAPLGD